MSEIAVQFLMQKYDMDEATAKGIVGFYKLFNGDQTAPPSTVGVLTPEELLEMQRRQQRLTTGTLTPAPERIQVSVPQSFGAGGAVPPGPTQTPAENEPNPVNPWWYLIGAWNFITDPIWITGMIASGALSLPALRNVIRGGGTQIIGPGGTIGLRPSVASGQPLITGSGVSVGGQPAQPGFWSRTSTRIRGAIPSSRTTAPPITRTVGTTAPATQTGFWSNLRSSITAGGRGIQNYLFGGGAAGGLGAIYAPAASTLIAAAIPLAGIIGARTVGGALAPEYHEELSRQGYNEWLRPYVPMLMPAASTPEGRQQQFELTRASRPFWAGIEQAGRQLGAFTWPWEEGHQAYINP